MARPSLLTNELADKIASLCEEGVFRKCAADCVGISESSLTKWMERGGKDIRARRDTPHAYLWRKVVQAEGNAQLDLLRIVQKAAKIDARHAEWLLSRRWPEFWARHDNVQLTGEGGGPVKIENVRDRVREKLAGLLARPPDGGDGGSGPKQGE